MGKVRALGEAQALRMLSSRSMSEESCVLCDQDGGVVLFRDRVLRIVRVSDERYPAFLRVILNAHAREMTDLPEPVQHRIFAAVLASERVLRRLTPAHKVNLASLGNMTPHVHWHVIVRHPEDAHFPDSIWSRARRESPFLSAVPDDAALATALARELDGE